MCSSHKLTKELLHTTSATASECANAAVEVAEAAILTYVALNLSPSAIIKPLAVLSALTSLTGSISAASRNTGIENQTYDNRTLKVVELIPSIILNGAAFYVGAPSVGAVITAAMLLTGAFTLVEVTDRAIKGNLSLSDLAQLLLQLGKKGFMFGALIADGPTNPGKVLEYAAAGNVPLLHKALAATGAGFASVCGLYRSVVTGQKMAKACKEAKNEYPDADASGMEEPLHEELGGSSPNSSPNQKRGK